MNRTIKLSLTKRIALMGAVAVILGTVAQAAHAQMPLPIVPKSAARDRGKVPPPPPPPKPAPKK